jgi:hypothetical protein
MDFKGEVAGIEQVELGVGSRWYASAPARPKISSFWPQVIWPQDEHRRLSGAEVLLEAGVEVEVELVVPEQLQLDFLVSGPVHARLVQ